jgi:16S rRNA (guanine527-N7)-methyltransferase
MTSAAPRPISTAAAFSSAFGVSRETTGRLETYARLLAQWQKAVNLVAPATLPDVWHRHFADSAQLVALLPDRRQSIVDLGSGAGFPGLVIAILLAARNAASIVTLVESDTRKAAFLRETARSIGVPVDILVTRIENTETQVRLERADVVTARALAPLPRLLGLISARLPDHATGLFLKGRDAASELAAARAQFDFGARLVPSVTDPDARIAIVTALRAKPKE